MIQPYLALLLVSEVVQISQIPCCVAGIGPWRPPWKGNILVLPMMVSYQETISESFGDSGGCGLRGFFGASRQGWSFLAKLK